MAGKKQFKPDTGPKVDNSVSDLDVSRVTVEMPTPHFNGVIRMLRRNASHDSVMQFRDVTFNALKRLGAKRDLSKAVATLPGGSDHCDVRSIYVWMDRVVKADKKAVAQIVAMDATAVARTG